MGAPTTPSLANGFGSTEAVAADPSLTERHDEQAADRGLCQYLLRVAAGLGLGAEAACWEIAGRATAYLALEDRLPGVPNRDAALVWDSRHGWAVGVEYGSRGDVLVLAYMGEPLLPEPEAVTTFVETMLAGHGAGQSHPPEIASTNLTRRLAEYAPPPATG